MKHNFSKLIVVSLGGSIICPDEIDYRYLRKFKSFILKWTRRSKSFLIIAGGGRISRRYQEAAAKIDKLNHEDKDWIGIHATRLNAHLLRTIFRKYADPVVLDRRHRLKRLRKSITIASGWQPGWSTDYVTAALASDFGAHEMIIAGKPSHVYDKDHEVHSGAVAFEKMSWGEYRKLVPPKWKPGSHAPVDPVAARLAQRHKITAFVMDGRNLKNFDSLIAGRDSQGTIIQ